MDLVISRKRWIRGGDGMSYLLRDTDKKMCCLGFYLRSCGVRPSKLTDRESPREVTNAKGDVVMPPNAAWLVTKTGADSRTCLALMRINDDDDDDPFAADETKREAKREAKIARIFAKHDVRVTFTD